MEEIIKEAEVQKHKVFKDVVKYLGKKTVTYIFLMVDIREIRDTKEEVEDSDLDILKLKELFKIIERKEENIDLIIDLFMLIKKLEELKK